MKYPIPMIIVAVTAASKGLAFLVKAEPIAAQNHIAIIVIANQFTCMFYSVSLRNLVNISRNDFASSLSKVMVVEEKPLSSQKVFNS